MVTMRWRRREKRGPPMTRDRMHEIDNAIATELAISCEASEVKNERPFGALLIRDDSLNSIDSALACTGSQADLHTLVTSPVKTRPPLSAYVKDLIAARKSKEFAEEADILISALVGVASKCTIVPACEQFCLTSRRKMSKAWSSSALSSSSEKKTMFTWASTVFPFRRKSVPVAYTVAASPKGPARSIDVFVDEFLGLCRTLEEFWPLLLHQDPCFPNFQRKLSRIRKWAQQCHDDGARKLPMMLRRRLQSLQLETATVSASTDVIYLCRWLNNVLNAATSGALRWSEFGSGQ